VDQVPLSPLSFSRSVHNTASGLFSIATGSTKPSTALAATTSLFLKGLLEAVLQVLSRGEPVLLVISDQTIAPLYSEFFGAEEAEWPAYATAMMLHPGGSLRSFFSHWSSDNSLDVSPFDLVDLLQKYSMGEGY
jgi:hypothetical protein